MIKKALIAVGLGNVLNIASLSSVNNIACKNAPSGTELCALVENGSERGFPFGYLEKAEASAVGQVPETEFIFANATYNLIFWIAASVIIVYLLFWIIGKFSKLVFLVSLLAVGGLITLAFLAG